jgi:hypothetical protein
MLANAALSSHLVTGKTCVVQHDLGSRASNHRPLYAVFREDVPGE